MAGRRRSGNVSLAGTFAHRSTARTVSAVTGGPANPPTFVTSAASGDSSFSTSHTASNPTGLVNGNLLVMAMYANGASVFPAISGWTLDGSNIATNQASAVYHKTVAGDAASFGVTFSASCFFECVIMQFSGASGMDATPTFGGNSAGTSSGTAPSITATSTKRIWITVFGMNGTATASTPAGFTARAADSAHSNSIASFTQVLSASGPTGTATSNFSAGTGGGYSSCLVKP